MNDLNMSKEKIMNNSQSIAPTSPIDITFEDVIYEVDVESKTQESSLPCNKQYEKKTILKKISGIFKAGEVTAIMGASGAGKTTLLNVLACRVPQTNVTTGTLQANGVSYNYQTFGNFANYVMQSDILQESLTVRQTLQFAADLKLDLPEAEKDQRLSQLIKDLKLESALDGLVGGAILKGISGGEKKRTSIGFELITNPQVIFLDEPTSGLDSLTSFIIVSYLRKLAKQQNKTVIMTIHQPNSDIFRLFDNLMLLIEGSLVYNGSAKEVTEYFKKNLNLTCPQFSNPPDFFMSKMHHEDQTNVKRYPMMFDSYNKLQAPKVNQMIKEKRSDIIQARSVNVSGFVAFKALLKRDLLKTARNPLKAKAKIFQAIFLSLFVGGMFFGINRDYTNKDNWRSLLGFHFFISISAFMGSLAPITLLFPKERNVFLKEQGSKMYSVLSYFASRNIVEFPFLIIVPLLQSSIMYWMIGLEPTVTQFFKFYLVMFLVSLSGDSIGLFIGSLFKNERVVAAVQPIVILPFIMFSGFYKNTGDLPSWIGWLQYISPLKYSFIAFINNQVNGVTSPIVQLNFDIGEWNSVYILIGLSLAFRVLSLFFLNLLKAKLQ